MAKAKEMTPAVQYEILLYSFSCFIWRRHFRLSFQDYLDNCYSHPSIEEDVLRMDYGGGLHSLCYMQENAPLHGRPARMPKMRNRVHACEKTSSRRPVKSGVHSPSDGLFSMSVISRFAVLKKKLHGKTRHFLTSWFNRVPYRICMQYIPFWLVG